MKKNPIDVAKYLLFKCSYYGDIITNLKMQKILYFVYVCCLVRKSRRCFEERFQAWPNGPVLPSVYSKLRSYGASPISEDFSAISDEEDLKKIKNGLGSGFVTLIDEVYDELGGKSAFELVGLTHSDPAWISARRGLQPFERSNNELSDSIIKGYYGKKG